MTVRRCIHGRTEKQACAKCNAEDQAMTAPYQALRDALEAGPTPGPWTQQDRHVIDFTDTGRFFAVLHTDDSIEVRNRTAAYIAAADPSTIRELLAERDALAAVAEAAPMGDDENGYLILERVSHRPSGVVVLKGHPQLGGRYCLTDGGDWPCARVRAAYDRAVSKP